MPDKKIGQYKKLDLIKSSAFDKLYDLIGTNHYWELINTNHDPINKLMIWNITTQQLLGYLKECNLDLADLMNVERTTFKLTKEKFVK